jgi:Raf kinase inhibitor-like YbhB/YbcL family protein
MISRGEGVEMNLSSPSFKPNAIIPSAHTCDGEDVSPALDWTDPPAATKSFALISDDPDAPSGSWVHWVIWNIPAQARGLPENLPKKGALSDGTRQGANDFGRIGYGGPCPPSGTHRYTFRLYALDVALELPEGARKAHLERAMNAHVLSEAELMGKYHRS